MQLYEEPPDARVVIFSKGKILTEREPIPSPGIDEAPLSIGDNSASGSPLEALHLPDGATVGRGREKRPRPTERPPRMLIYSLIRVYITLSDLTKTVNYLTKVYYFSYPELY